VAAAARHEAAAAAAVGGAVGPRAAAVAVGSRSFDGRRMRDTPSSLARSLAIKNERERERERGRRLTPLGHPSTSRPRPALAHSLLRRRPGSRAGPKLSAGDGRRRRRRSKGRADMGRGRATDDGRSPFPRPGRAAAVPHPLCWVAVGRASSLACMPACMRVRVHASVGACLSVAPARSRGARENIDRAVFVVVVVVHTRARRPADVLGGRGGGVTAEGWPAGRTAGGRPDPRAR